jgi:hypothetical protein
VGIAAYTQPAAGYCTAWPPAHLGQDLVGALHRARITAADLGTCAALGWAAVPLGAGDRPLPGAVRIMAPDADADGARVVALGLLPRGPVALCKAVAHAGPVTVWRIVERLDVCRADALPPGAQALGPGAARMGLTKAAAGPKFGIDVQALARKLATELHSPQVSEAGLAAVREALGALDLNWGKATKPQIDHAFTHARHALAQVAAATGGQLLPEWNERIRVSLLNTAGQARKWQHDYFYPRIGLSLRQPDQLAIAQVSQQQGWFLRNEMGARSDKLTAEGRKIVDVGIREGWGRDSIGRALQSQLTDLWGAQGFNYARTVAAVAVNRARAFSEASGYQDAGIESLEIVAMLDERTTDICRCMDGQILPVGGCYSHAVQAASVATPEDIYKVAPFMRTTWDAQAEAFQVATRTGAKIATVTRSGVGAVDDRGDFSMHAAGAGLLGANVGLPPYHFNCRTTTVPRITSSQVPRGETAVAAPVPVQPPTPLPPALPPMLAGVGAAPASAALPAQRPIVGMATPTEGNPSAAPGLPAVEAGPLTDPLPPGGPGTTGQALTLRQVTREITEIISQQLDAHVLTSEPKALEMFVHPKHGPHVVAHAKVGVSTISADILGWSSVHAIKAAGKAISVADMEALIAELKAAGWTREANTWTPPRHPPKGAPKSPALPDATPMQGAGAGPALQPTPMANKKIRDLIEFQDSMGVESYVTGFSVLVQDVGSAAETYWITFHGTGLEHMEKQILAGKAEYEAIRAESLANLGKPGPPYVPPPPISAPGVKPAKLAGLPETPMIDNVIGSAVQGLEESYGGKYLIHGVKPPAPGEYQALDVFYTVPGSKTLKTYSVHLPNSIFATVKAEAKALKLDKKTGWQIPAEKVPPGKAAAHLHPMQKAWKLEAQAEHERQLAQAAAAKQPPPPPPPDIGPDHLGPLRPVAPQTVIKGREDAEASQRTKRTWEQRGEADGKASEKYVQQNAPGIAHIRHDAESYAGQRAIWEKIGQNADADAMVRKLTGVSEARWADMSEDTRLAYRMHAGGTLKSGWAGSSMDYDLTMHALQAAIREEFGLADAMTATMKRDLLEEMTKTYSAAVQRGFRAYVRGLYNATQEHLAKQGIKSLNLYRGMSIRLDWEQPVGITFTGEGRYQIGNVALQPASSFTLDPYTAYKFSGDRSLHMVIHMEVPASRILGLGELGMGTMYEVEFGVLGGVGQCGGVFWDSTQALKYAGIDGVFDAFEAGTAARAAAAEAAPPERKPRKAKPKP